MTARRVLVVEDNADHLAILERRLRAEGIEPASAGTAAEAIALAAATAFDAAILDMKLPDMDGDSTLVQLLAAQPELPVLVLSAAAFGETRARALALGARAALLKPVSRTELVATLRGMW
jgi:DNA-binding response OmpR family regulator